jgi:L-2-hydroxyglutarate oxidase LhgO
VDSHALMLALQGDLENAGGVVALASQMESADFVRPGAAVVTVRSQGTRSQWQARQVVNAAGLYACHLAQRFDGLAPQYVPTPRFAKGNYFSLTGRAPFSRLIYPVPSAAGLGVHLTLDLGGQAKFGPDVQWLDATHPNDIDYTVDASRAESAYEEVRRYWPALPNGALHPSYSGVRPKIAGPAQAAADFRIDGPQVHGVAGLVNLFGIESPGLTAALAIGEHVVQLLATD